MSDQKFLPDEDQILEALLNAELQQNHLLGKNSHRWSSRSYTDVEVFQKEQNFFSSRVPVCLGAEQELSSTPFSYLLRDVWGSSWIVIRGDQGRVHALLNRCRHRGMKLLDQPCGEAKHLTCPYHAWTYTSSGECVAIPKKAEAFPDLDLQQVALTRRQVASRNGLLWMLQENDSSDSLLQPLDPHFKAWKLDQCMMKETKTFFVESNWKIVVEAFLEAYHVPYIHRSTLAPATVNFSWINQVYGPHSRAVYPLKRLKADPELKRAPLRRYLSVVYHLFPNSFVSFQPFHALLMRSVPISVDRTSVELTLLALPEDVQNHADMVARDIDFVTQGLLEDFATAKEIQKVAANPADQFVAGNFEQLIAHFHENLKSMLDSRAK